jgi:hypothetical protein
VDRHLTAETQRERRRRAREREVVASVGRREGRDGG